MKSSSLGWTNYNLSKDVATEGKFSAKWKVLIFFYYLASYWLVDKFLVNWYGFEQKNKNMNISKKLDAIEQCLFISAKWSHKRKSKSACATIYTWKETVNIIRLNKIHSQKKKIILIYLTECLIVERRWL